MICLQITTEKLHEFLSKAPTKICLTNCRDHDLFSNYNRKVTRVSFKNRYKNMPINCGYMIHFLITTEKLHVFLSKTATQICPINCWDMIYFQITTERLFLSKTAAKICLINCKNVIYFQIAIKKLYAFLSKAATKIWLINCRDMFLFKL